MLTTETVTITRCAVCGGEVRSAAEWSEHRKQHALEQRYGPITAGQYAELMRNAPPDR